MKTKREVAMGTATDKILEEALLLPADQRASLVERLLQSLNLPTEAEINRLWAEEAERRVSQLESGKVDLVPGEQVFTRIRAKYQR
jgi:putative addiction module component (TIGR02574 family)